MTKKDCIIMLNECEEYASKDREDAHGKADDILFKYINDPDITEAFNRWDKWYA